MRRSLLALLLIAPPAFAQPLPTWDGKNAVAEAGARASLSPDGAWLPKPLKTARTLEVYDDSGERLQFAEHWQGLKLTLYIESSALGTYTTEPVKLYPSLAATNAAVTTSSPGMNLHAGTRIEEQTAAADGFTKVKVGWKWGSSSLVIRGLVATAKIGKVYKMSHGNIPEFAPDVTLPGNYKLLDAPNGSAFAISTNKNRLDAMTLDRKGKHTLVRVSQGAVGWIATQQTKRIPKSSDDGELGGVEGGVMGGMAGGLLVGDTYSTLAKSTLLYDAIDGRAIGEVAWEYRLAPVKEEKGWSQFDVDTRFGLITVWAKPGSLKTRTASQGGSAPPPPPAPPGPHMVPPTQLESHRLTGTKLIVPSDATKDEILASGKDKIIGSFKLCLDDKGIVKEVRLLKSTGFAAYDAKLQAEMKTWTYKPYVVNGKAVPVCTAVTFIYSQK